MADAGTQQQLPSPSWAEMAREALEDELLGEQLAEDGAPARQREPYERVMIVYRSGPSLLGTTVAPTGTGSLALVIVDDPEAYCWFPPSMLRTVVHEQCVPLRVRERVGLDILRCEHPAGFPLSSPLNINSQPECPACGVGP